MSETATLTIPGTPPSFNAVGLHSHWTVGRRHKQQWESWLAAALMMEKVPRGLQRVEARAVLSFTTKRRRDEGNYRALLEKALGDMLQSGGWLSDDTPEHYRFGAVEIEAPASEALTTVSLSYQR